MSLQQELLENYGLNIAREDDRHIDVEGLAEPDLELEQYLFVLTGKTVRFRRKKRMKEEGFKKNSLADAISSLNQGLLMSKTKDELEDIDSLINKEPIIQFVNILFGDAIQKNASDIHIEAFEESIRIRIRIDGILQDYPAPDRAFYNAVVSRIKILAKLDIAQKRLPQDGRYTIEQDKDIVDFRISTIPTLYGESIVIRLLNKKQGLIRIQELGWEKEKEKAIREILGIHQGLILVTGPTGSGKSTTLYAFLQELNDGRTKILTIEDPVEYQINGINQMPVNPEINLTFAAGLRSILRQDPDIIMVGEIRDTETARIAVQAALTGHLVLSTLHTNDSISAINRMIDLGVESYLLAPALKAVIAQRLIRKICLKCRTGYKPDRKLIRDFNIKGKKTFYHGKGCGKCGNTGYKGRTALFEILRIDAQISEIINKNFSPRAVENAARMKGFSTLPENARKKVSNNLTTLEELNRVIEK